MKGKQLKRGESMGKITQHSVGSSWGVPMVKKPTVWGEENMKIYKVYFNTIFQGAFNSWEEVEEIFICWGNPFLSISTCEPITVVEVLK